MIEISVVVCTYNRADLLPQAIESLVQQTLNAPEYEILVVDNASTDPTPEVVRELQKQYGGHNILLLHEHNQGLGHARNTGAHHARGRYVAYMDDDAKASPDWLERALECFARVSPEPLAVGGAIPPWYDSARPQWFKGEYALRTWGDEPRFLKPGECFSGSNMILQREAIEAYGGFNVSVGVKGEYLSLGEEASLFWSIEETNKTPSLYYSPEVVVYHLWPRRFMSLSYKLKRGFATGQSLYHLHGPKSVRGRLGFLVWGLRWLLMDSVRALLARRRYPAWQNWVWERVTPVVIQAGRLVAAMGVYIKIRHR